MYNNVGLCVPFFLTSQFIFNLLHTLDQANIHDFHTDVCLKGQRVYFLNEFGFTNVDLFI